jgi:peptidoglycan/LPS O-acetylase OafA/YrhL
MGGVQLAQGHYARLVAVEMGPEMIRLLQAGVTLLPGPAGPPGRRVVLRVITFRQDEYLARTTHGGRLGQRSWWVATESFRQDIQGLRGLAVLFVLIFHLWPASLSGGYVGVDVFFVISGYLITRQLQRELESTGTLSLGRFYGRRIRRLLPAATVVLLATAMATVALMPVFRWHDIANDIVASALYVQNWRLAWQSVDYLAVDEAGGPLRHFWSLAIEEQFYLLWPILLLATTLLLRRAGWGMRSIVLAVSAITFLTSLSASILLTGSQPETAYFVSHARVWELALGGLLASLGSRADGGPSGGAGWRGSVMGALGVAMILASALLFNSDTPFPGYAALLPTMGTAICIWAGGAAGTGLVARMLGMPWLRWMGDISYSLYLWHWPLLVFSGYLLEGSSGVLVTFAVAGASLLAASLSTRWVENPFRVKKADDPAARPLVQDRRLLIASSTCAVLVSAGLTAWAGSQTAGWQTRQGSENHPGAQALFSGARVADGVDFIPALQDARRDVPIVYGNGCHQGHDEVVPRRCVIHAGVSKGMVALVGDSHAAHWIPALQDIGAASGRSVVSYTKSGCALTSKDVELRGRPYGACTEWSRAVVAELALLRPELVILARYRVPALFGTETRDESDRLTTSMYVSLLREMRSAGLDVVVIRDTPLMARDPLECLAGPGPCSLARSEAMAGPDPLAEAASREAHVIDMTDAICGQERCDYLVGNVLVWRDTHHLTATYARSMAPLLGERLGIRPGGAGPESAR